MVSEPIHMQAAVLRRMGEAMSVEEVLLDPPGQQEVRVRVAAAGVCHSDLHLAEGHLGSERVPIVLGHEGAGIVEAVGPDVASHAPGDRVAFCFVPACGACRQCVTGRRNLCERAGEYAWKGTMPDGTTRLHTVEGERLLHFNFVSCFAEACVVPVASAVPLPGGIPLWKAALVGCGVVTAFGAVQDVARVQPGDSVCVIGCGGVGLHVITAARMAGATTIVAVDRGAEKLERARGFGATHAVDANRDVVEAVRGLSDGGVDHAFEVVGRADTIRQAWDVLRPGATAVIVGLAPRGIEITLPGLDLLSEKGMRGTYYGSGDPAARIRSLADLAVSDGLPIGDAVSDVTDLPGIDAAFGRLRDGVGARTIVLLDPGLAGYPT